jgi:hypothetical protein
MKKILTLGLVITSAAVAYGTYAGSVVSSFYAEPLKWEGVPYYPVGLTYGRDYIWVVYAHGYITQRTTRGSIVSSYDAFHTPLRCIGRDESRGYIYGAIWGEGVFWIKASTGSRVGSFGLPPGATRLNGLDFDESAPSSPIWVSELYPTYQVWNLGPTGNVVASFDLYTWPGGPQCLAMDADTPGGPFLFVGTQSAPPTIFAVRPSSFSIISSFIAPVHNYGICDLSWDGQFLWVVENGRETPPGQFGMVYRFVGHTFPAVVPASVGKIKALYR